VEINEEINDTDGERYYVWLSPDFTLNGVSCFHYFEKDIRGVKRAFKDLMERAYECRDQLEKKLHKINGLFELLERRELGL